MRFILVFADRRATARTTTFVEPCSIQLKKKNSSSFSPRVLRSPTDSLALRVLRCGILCSPVFSLCSYPSISPPVSLLRYGMVGTVAGDGAPRSLSVVRSSGVSWTRPFSFSDSSLVGPRPFSLSLFHPARALCVVFVALSCHVRYWLGFFVT